MAESSRPSDPAIAGSAATSTSTATDREWTAWVPTPRDAATSTAPAITAARSTAGSARVTTTNHATVSATSTRWPRAPTPASPDNSATPATTTATFEPETATRWVRPTSAMRSWAPADSRRVSPVTSPTARPARSPPSPRRAPDRTRSRTYSVEASRRPGGATTLGGATGSTRATT